MILEEFDKDSHSGPVEKIKAGAVYFATEGRNAWHSTWVVKYAKNSVHSSLDSAKSFCEKARKNGSVFYIKRLPCLIVHGSKGAVVVTEINNNNPLGRHLLLSRSLGRDYAVAKRLVCNSLEDLSDMRMGFGVCSHAWGAGKGKPNSILLMQSRSGVVFEGQPDSSRLWRSSSNGSAYKLHWVEHESAIVSSGVTELVAVLRGIGLGVDSSVEENDGKRVIDFFDNNKNNSDGLLSVKAVLRKVAVERGFKGNEKARDNAIEVFVSELLEVFSERVLLSLDDKRLGDLYEDWLKSLKHLSKGERGEALLEFILNVRIPFSLYRIGRDRV